MLVRLFKLSPSALPWIFGIVGGFLALIDSDLQFIVPPILVFVYAIIISQYLKENPASIVANHYIDSVYFLGFLFTLITVAIVFIKLRFSDEGNLDEVNEIFSLLGIASLTTIIGLLGRNTIKGRYSEKYKEVIESEIANNLQNLIDLTDKFVKQSQDYGKVLENIDDFFQTRASDLDSLRMIEQSYLDSLAQFKDNIDQFAKEQERQRKQFEEALEIQSDSLEKKLELINKKIDAQIDALGTSNKSLDEFRGKLQDTNAELTIANKLLSKIPQTSSEIEEFTEATQELGPALTDFVELVKEYFSDVENNSFNVSD